MVNHKSQLDSEGWLLIESTLNESEIDCYKDMLDCCEVYYQQWKEYRQPGIFHHLPFADYRFLSVLEKADIEKTLLCYFGSEFILNSFGAVVNYQSVKKDIYVKEIHRDINTYIKGEPIMVNIVVMLDKFTGENGAIELLPGSHRYSTKPSENEFTLNKKQVTAKAGSILFFNSYIWHCAGVSQVIEKRRALTITCTPQFYKQQADYSLVFDQLPEEMKNSFYKKILGKTTKVPKSLDEWYIDYEKNS